MHYPVVNKNGDTIASALTNLDLHDIARAAKTYGVKSFYVVTPLSDQMTMAERLVSHWTEGRGAAYNPARRKALELIRLKTDFEDVICDIRSNGNGSPKVVVTCAKGGRRKIGYGEFRNRMKDGKPYLIIFGTAWGLSDAFIERADYVLEPIMGSADYNHLSVRCAAAIILDRLAEAEH
jgi:hypothetical protein